MNQTLDDAIWMVEMTAAGMGNSVGDLDDADHETIEARRLLLLALWERCGAIEFEVGDEWVCPECGRRFVRTAARWTLVS